MSSPSPLPVTSTLLHTNTATVTVTTTAPSRSGRIIPTVTTVRPGFGEPSGSAPYPTATDTTRQSNNAKDSGVSVETVFYAIAILGLIIAVFYTIHIVRRDRRRRRLEREGRDSEAAAGTDNNGRTRYTSTYRPEDDDVCPPPQYRTYNQDQPYVEPEMAAVIYPDQVYYLPGAQHLQGQSAAGSMSSQQALLSTLPGSNRPILRTITTTTTTTTTITTCSPSPSSSFSPSNPTGRSIAAPNANAAPGQQNVNAICGDQGMESLSTTGSSSLLTSVPVISAPSPAFTFTAGRHLSTRRSGLAGSNNSLASGHRSLITPSASATATAVATQPLSSTSSSPSGSRAVSPAPTSVQNLLSASSAVSSDDAISSTRALENQLPTAGNSNMTEQQGRSGRAGMLQPILNRLRSQGPPPYIPMAPEEAAPQLPPEYVTAVSH